jgi:hypothetical protein
MSSLLVGDEEPGKAHGLAQDVDLHEVEPAHPSASPKDASMTCMPALALRISVALAALVLPAVDAGYGPWHGSAFAASVPRLARGAASCATDRASNIAGSAAWPKVSPSR